MLTVAKRASVNSAYSCDFPVDQFARAAQPEPQDVQPGTDTFVDALERVISGEPAMEHQPPGSPDLDALARLLIDALSSREIALTLEGANAAYVRGMPGDSWETVNRLFEATAVTGPIHATIGTELTDTSATLVAGLQLLGVNSVDVHAPVSTAELRLNTVCTPNSGQRPWQPRVTVTRTTAGSSLKHIYVNAGAVVVGRGFSGLGVTVHSTDDEGCELWSSPLEQAPVEPAWKQALFVALSSSLRGLVLDLSGWTGERATQALELQPDDWFQWQAIAGVDLSLVLVSPDLQSGRPLIEGVDQVCTSDIDQQDGPSKIDHQPLLSSEDYERADHLCRQAFIAAMYSGTPEFNATLFDALLDRVHDDAPTVLDLSTGVCHEVAAEIRKVTRDAWKALLNHPDAAWLDSVLMSDAMADAGPLPIALAQARA